MSILHEISYQWFTYWWLSDKGNGPEAIQQIAIGVVGAAALLPIARKVIRNDVRRVHSEMTGVDHELEKLLPDLLKPIRWLWKKVHHGNGPT